jgi:hypothetical protein
MTGTPSHAFTNAGKSAEFADGMKGIDCAGVELEEKKIFDGLSEDGEGSDRV